MNLYIFKSGTLKLENKSIAYLYENNKKLFIPINQIDHVHIFGEVNLNKRILTKFSEKRISITLYNYVGKPIGNFIPNTIKSGKIIMNQVNAYQKLECRNYISFNMLSGQIHNILNILNSYLKKQYDLNKQIDHIKLYQEELRRLKLDDENYIMKAMMIEAKAKQEYYHLFDIVCAQTLFSFNRRSTNPPENEINAMMSYGYAVLYSDILCYVYRSSLLAEISFIHSANTKKATLQFDIADIFKSIIVDRLIIRLIRRKQITTEDFIYESNSCYMNENGCRIFIKEYEKQMKITVYDNRSKRKYSYRQLLKKEVYELSNYIEKGDSYASYKARW